jgi:hypothetical protein
VKPILLLCIALAACAHARHATPETRLDCAGPHTLADSANGRMQGTVMDAQTDAPLSDLLVSIQGRGHEASATTDGRGHWLVGDLPEGEYVIVVSRDRDVFYRTDVHLCPEDVLTLRTPVRRP